MKNNFRSGVMGYRFAEAANSNRLPKRVRKGNIYQSASWKS
jgi:hypothetical protein